MKCSICGDGSGTIVAHNGNPPVHAQYGRCLKRLKAEHARYKDALYHIGYRDADPVRTAKAGLGDREEAHA